MEELSKIAMAHYQASSDDIQQLARDFFCAMDNDGDGKIDQKEFLEFMRDEGCLQMKNPSFFKQLDLDGNGTLDFVEVMTLYYIVKSGRPFCDHCKKFISSTYLTCVGCLEDPIGGSFYLCLDCYMMQKCDHAHNGLSRFLDNYSLLEAMNKSKLTELRSPQARSKPSGTGPVLDKPHSGNNQTWNQSLAMVQVPYRPPPVATHNHHQWSPYPPTGNPYGPTTPPIHNHTWIQNNYSYHYPPSFPVQLPATSTAVVPQRQQWKVAFGALNAALTIGSLATGSSLCSIL
ncbi:Serine/threonine-protein phosphatase [Artemisia annua]|uniref:Serine/threonine-protein phosphatase n=1 Tax=Artemisia annua TaxID=35608 RepID=A0A2U1NNM1_ARTAN|nr:Serine/threonine-protein phosphatase [Artemisia annua]